jgi:hypothetical protein
VNEWSRLAQDLVNAALRIADAVEQISEHLNYISQDARNADAGKLLVSAESSRRTEGGGD